MKFKIWGTNYAPLEGADTLSQLRHQFSTYVNFEDIEAENMIEACRQAKDSEKHNYRYLRVVGNGFAVEFNTEVDFPEAELTGVLGRLNA